MRILIVEDEVRAAAYLRQGLSEAGFSVEVAHDGVEGEHLALTQAFDLLILDVMLPGRSGWENSGQRAPDEPDARVVFDRARPGGRPRARAGSRRR